MATEKPSVSLDNEKPRAHAPTVAAPPEAQEKLVRVHVMKEIHNVFIGGKRYSFKKGTEVDVPVEIAYTFRSDGSVV